MPNSTNAPRDKPPQFGIGCLLTIVTLFAGLFALAAPFAADFDRNQWMVIISVFTGIAIGPIPAFLLIYVPRRLARKRAGALLLTFSGRHGSPVLKTNVTFHLVGAVGVGFVGFVVLLGGLLLECPRYSESPLKPVQSLTLCSVAAIAMLPLIAVATANPPPQLREQGLLIELKLTPWEKLTTARWSTLQPDVLRIGSYGVDEIPVPPEDRERVEAILREYCPNLFPAGEAAAVD